MYRYIKLPIKTAVSLVSDTTKMHATDGAARSMLINGFKAVPLRVHFAQAASLGAMIMGMTVGKWWSSTALGKALKKARVSFVYNLRRTFAEKMESTLPARSVLPTYSQDDSDDSSGVGSGQMFPAAA